MQNVELIKKQNSGYFKRIQDCRTEVDKIIGKYGVITSKKKGSNLLHKLDCCLKRFNGDDSQIRELYDIKQVYLENRDKIIGINQGLVVSLVKIYAGMGLEIEDLIQEGNIGLMKAIDKYDSSLGFEFSTYASYWIHSKAQKGLKDLIIGKDIKVPQYVNSKFSTYNASTSSFAEKNQRAPTKLEISEMLQLGAKELRRIETSLLVSKCVSLERVSEEDLVLAGFVEKKDSIYDNIEIKNDSIIDFIQKSPLEKIEKKVLLLRNGFIRKGVYGESLNLREIGEKVNLSRERIRQIEAKAIDRFHDYLKLHPINA